MVVFFYFTEVEVVVGMAFGGHLIRVVGVFIVCM